MKNEQTIRDLARGFVPVAHDFLKGKLGHDPDEQELALFSQEVSSRMISQSLLAIFKALAPDPGNDVLGSMDHYLKGFLVSLAAGVRLQKIPVMVQFGVEVAPAQSEEVEPELPSCSCILKNGECTSCSELLHLRLTNLGRTLAQYIPMVAAQTKLASEGCPICFARYADLAISRLPSKLDPSLHGKEVLCQALGGLIQVASTLGVADLPLTMKAIQELS